VKQHSSGEVKVFMTDTYFLLRIYQWKKLKVGLHSLKLRPKIKYTTFCWTWPTARVVMSRRSTNSYGCMALALKKTHTC